MHHINFRKLTFPGLWLFLFVGLNVPAFADVQGYILKTIEGREVYVGEIALNSHAKKTQQALDLLKTNLQEIDQMAMSKTAKDALKSVNIFVEWEREKRGAAVYHPNAEWLAKNGWQAEKHETVNIVNISNFINWTSANQPYMVLHELAHAYHNKVLGDENSEVLNAFSQAIESGIYDKVAYFNGIDTNTRKKAYATANVQEYFAEVTEAYFGKNDFFPFNRKELKDHDPAGYAVVEKVWQHERQPATTPIVSDPPPTAEVLFNSEKYYRLTSKWQGTGKSLDVINDGENNQLQLAETGAYSGQYWKLQKLSNNYYRLTTQWQGDGKSLDVGVKRTGNNVQLSGTGDLADQYWRIEQLDDVYYRITSKIEGMSKSLDVINDGNNNALQLSETGDYSGQYWRITEIE